MSDSSRVTGQPAPPTPRTDEFATDWLIVDFDAAARAALDLATNPRISAKLELLRGHIFAIAQTYHEQMRGDYRKHPEAAAQPLTPPQPPPPHRKFGACADCGDPTVTDSRGVIHHIKWPALHYVFIKKCSPPQQVQDVTASPATASTSEHADTSATVKSVEYSRPDSASLTAEELAPRAILSNGWYAPPWDEPQTAIAGRWEHYKQPSLTAAELAQLLVDEHSYDAEFAPILAKDICSLPGIKVVRG